MVIAAFAAIRRAISGAAIHIIIVAPPISSRGLMILIPVHHASHLALTHAVHVHAVLATLPRRPISIDPRVFGAAAISVAGLVRLLRCAVRLSWGVLGLGLARLLGGCDQGQLGWKIGSYPASSAEQTR
ncbi:hypothetical protein ACVWWG_002888 [Bradyrhizobium sp. LB7.2]